MARYEGRHRAKPTRSTPPLPSASSRRTAEPGRHSAPLTAASLHGGAPPTAASLYEQVSQHARRPGAAPTAVPSTPQLTRRALKERANPPRRTARPVVVGTLAVGLGASAIGFATTDLGQAETAFVVGDNVVAQTAELSRTTMVDRTYRAAASVSRNERRTAIVATGLRSAAALEKKKKEEAAKRAEARRRAEEAAERERIREQAIANAKQDPQSAARVLMADHGWTSDAQFNCLVALWNGESGWRWWAENPSSGAYGIPQSLPASKMATFGSDYRTNPITQIRWGLWYIGQVYGSPCNAYSTWQARSPHWY